MSTTNRTAQLTKLHKVLKKHFKPTAALHDQPVLQSMLLGSCLENARTPAAEAVFELLKTSFFDWNEVRVSTVKELAEVMHSLPEPEAAATRLKGVLQSVFESEYSFDLDALKKQNLGQAIKRLQKLDGATPFNVAFTVQTSLGGHSIPIDRGALGVMYVLGVISENESRSGNVTGLERAIPKSKGQEFGSLLHQLAAEFVAGPYSTSVRDLLLSIAPDAKDRLPKRPSKKPEPAPVEAPRKASADKDKASADRDHAKHKEADKAKGKPAVAAKKPVPVAKKPEPARKEPVAKKKVPAQAQSAKAKVTVKTAPKRKPR